MNNLLSEAYVFLWLGIPLLILLLTIFVAYIGIYKIITTEKYFPYIIFVFIGGVLSFLYFWNINNYNGDDLNRYEHNSTDLLIGLKNQNPCFYFDESNKIIEDSYIDRIEITSFDKNISANQKEKTIWSVYGQDHNLPINKKLPLKSIVGKENCLEYGDKRVYDNKPEKFEPNHIYTAFIYTKHYTTSQNKSTYSTMFPYEYTIKGEKNVNR